MFWNWLKRLFGKTDEAAVYQLKERLIYHYFDGQKQVDADPSALYRRVMDVGPELANDMDVATSSFNLAGKAREKAWDSAIAEIRKIFDVKPLAEGGLTEIEAIRLFDHFMNYSSNLKKNSKTSQILPTPTEAFKPTSTESRPIPNTTDSGSTGGESSTAAPAPSCSASV